MSTLGPTFQGPGRVDLAVFGIFWRKISGTSDGAHATPTKASLLAPASYRYPQAPTYKLNGSSFGRPGVDLMFAKWAVNISTTCRGAPPPRAGHAVSTALTLAVHPSPLSQVSFRGFSFPFALRFTNLHERGSVSRGEVVCVFVCATYTPNLQSYSNDKARAIGGVLVRLK